MPRDPRAWLWDIQQAAKRVSRFLDGHDLPSYQSSDLVRSAVERQFEIIGEALSQLGKHSPRACRSGAALARDHRVQEHADPWLCDD